MRKVAKMIGVNHSTLNRFENGYSLDGDVLALIIAWALSNGISLSSTRPRK